MLAQRLNHSANLSSHIHCIIIHHYALSFLVPPIIDHQYHIPILILELHVVMRYGLLNLTYIHPHYNLPDTQADRYS